jgi:hypothetical protein
MRRCLLIFLPLLAWMPYREVCAVSPFLYMMGHTGWLHYACNLVAWLLLYRVVTVGRTLAALACASMVWEWLPKTPPVLGWSVVLYFYFGMLLSRRNWAGLVLPASAGLLIPGLAAWHHLAMLACGYVYRRIEKRWIRTRY